MEIGGMYATGTNTETRSRFTGECEAHHLKHNPASDELEHAVNQEQMENPALEVNESRVCLFCGTQLYGPTCTACGRFAQQVLNTSESSNNYEPLLYPQWDDQQRPYELSDIRAAYDSGLADSDESDDFDPLASIPTG